MYENMKSIESIQEESWRKNRHPHVGGIEVTPFCNLKCIHCYLQDQTATDILSTAELKLIIDKLYAEGVLFLYFTGGEIFTRKDFLEIYIYAKKLGFIVELLTNGTLINQEIIDVFNEYPPALVSISMYGGDEESYQRVTGKIGMFDKVIHTFDLLKLNDIHFQIKYIGTKENENDFNAVQSTAIYYGAEFSYSMELFPTLNGNSCTKNHMMELSKIIEIESRIEGKKEEYSHLASIENPFIHQKEVSLYLCDFAITNFLIDYQGYINPCHKCRIKKWNLLNCQFRTAWDDYLSMLKEKSDPNNKCLKCEYLMMCSPCVMVNYLSTGDYNVVPESLCQLTHMRVNELAHN